MNLSFGHKPAIKGSIINCQCVFAYSSGLIGRSPAQQEHSQLATE